ncbi:MAG TPA: Crp/Fnr family transcriptional regulator [Thiotrichales bacterium]|nr:Crp/Fnr family transcriptional regulator [Thiotrichales bacterium]
MEKRFGAVTDILENIPLFSTLDPAEREAICSHTITKSYPRNTIIINEGDTTQSLYIILEGKVKVFLSDSGGKEVTINMQGPGEYFGELALLDESPRSASIMTMEPSKFAIISKDDFDKVLTNNPTIALKLIRELTGRIRHLTENVKNLALLDVYGRVARTLLDLAEESDEPGVLVIRQKLTHQEIANMVGASREMVSRILKDLTLGGYIRVEGRQITIRHKLPPGW